MLASFPKPPHDYLRRLNPGAYQGLACVHWSMTVANRRAGWLQPKFYAEWRELHLHTLARYKLACPAFCLMPDHIHLLWIGLDPDSDQRKATKFFREHLNRLLRKNYGGTSQKPAYSLQLKAYDHVLTPEERRHDAFARIAFYIFENPVRKKLVSFWSDYAFSGGLVVGYPTLNPKNPDYWEKFWKIYQTLAKS